MGFSGAVVTSDGVPSGHWSFALVRLFFRFDETVYCLVHNGGYADRQSSYVDQAPPEAADRVFPTFVSTYLPPGAPGIIFAAILAATMSSMTSGINSLAGCLTMDFVGRLKPNYGHREKLFFARGASIMIGVLATLAAGLVQHMGSIFDISQAVIGVFLGTLLACMLFTISFLKVSSRLMMAGMLSGTVAGWFVAFSAASSLWVAPTATFVAMGLPALGIAWDHFTSATKLNS